MRNVLPLVLFAMVFVPFSSTILAQERAPISPPKSGAANAAQILPSEALSRTPYQTDIRVVRDGSRLANFVGREVFDEDNASIGTIRDLIVPPNDGAAFAVIAIGTSAMAGSRFVVAPLGAMHVRSGRVVLRGATKKSVNLLPTYKYPN